MTLDDRLREANRRRLEDTRRRIDAAGVPPIPAIATPPGRADGADDRFPLGRLVAVAAVTVAAVAVGGLAIGAVSNGDVTAPAGEVAGDGDGDGDRGEVGAEPTGADDDSASVIVVEEDGAERPDPEPTTGSDDREAEEDSGAEDNSGGEDDAGGSDGSGSAESAEEPAGDVGPSAQEPVATAVSEVCPSGHRAALEDAELSYVEGAGWDRLDDLVDEQDGPFRYVGWEPGHPDPVTVEVRPSSPVTVESIHLALDPSAPVSGVIEIELVAEAGDAADLTPIAVELDGVGGWAVHALERPVTVQALTIRRSAAESNVMELLLCTVD